MEIEFYHPLAGEMVLSAQRKRGQTPNQQRLAAEARAERAEAQLAQAVEALRDLLAVVLTAKSPDVTVRMRDFSDAIEAARATLTQIGEGHE
jgi:multidrug efflux pump subunit AcrA (membrane-fusion protein)